MKTGKSIIWDVGKYRPHTSYHIISREHNVTSSIMPTINSLDLLNFWFFGIGRINPDTVGGYNDRDW